MIGYLLRSIALGLVTALIVLIAVPSVRSNLDLPSDTADGVAANYQDIKISFNKAVQKAAPAVVNIYSQQYAQNDRTKVEKQGLGSGVIVSNKGYIITNYHVIAQADEVLITLQDGRFSSAQLVGKDKRSDLAILKIEMENLPVIPLNPDYVATVGDVVLAIGNPYNLGQTTTFGIISATGRSSIGVDGTQSFIQTDAAINEGNSGGALVNTRGELVGINTATFQQATELETYGISFAIPYTLANMIMEKIIADGRVIRGYVGISGADINAVTASLLGGDYVGAIIVLGVAPGGPADLGGLQKQDIILSIDGMKINGQQSVMDIVTHIRPGSNVDFEILRNGESMTLTLTIGEDPNE
jgi:serine protease DegS